MGMECGVTWIITNVNVPLLHARDGRAHRQAKLQTENDLDRHCGSHNAPGQARRGFPGCSHKQATPRSIRCLASVEPSSSASRLLQRQSIPALGSTFSSGQPCGRRDIAPFCLLCLGPWQRFWCFSPRGPPSAPRCLHSFVSRLSTVNGSRAHRHATADDVAAEPPRPPATPRSLRLSLGTLPNPSPCLAPLVGGAARS